MLIFLLLHVTESKCVRYHQKYSLDVNEMNMHSDTILQYKEKIQIVLIFYLP